ncbi:MAG: two-component system sensor histidine kinase CreC [Cardiobacteriaceae bacterium]|nr:two-component system sensor histidine kinase CreC [Cardiobacteriaceae bacterium]
MTIFIRLFLIYSLALCLGGILLIRDLQQQIRPGMRQVLEDTLADNAQTLAATLAPALENGDIHNPQWRNQLRAQLNPAQNARIYHHHKTANHQQLIITDPQGIVLYHTDPAETGRDYSQWNDIHLTLRGQYGARSTNSTMYVAAPIHAANGQLLGTVSLGKPSADIHPYQHHAQSQLRRTALLYLAATLALIALLTLWIRHSINRVRRYATAHAREQQAPRFHLASELNRLTDAISTMRRELEDRAYVTRYIETLTHELKSPLTAISASAELLEDNLPAPDRKRFAANIRQQSQRLHHLVQRLLQLSRIEKDPIRKQTIALVPLWQTLADEHSPRLAPKNLRLDTRLPPGLQLQADPFWLSQALANLLDNAIRETPPHHTITLSASQTRQHTALTLHNPTQHPIPDYALPRLFERYYTLNRAENSGLGLTLVQQIAEQHGGHARADTRDNGLAITLTLPNP